MSKPVTLESTITWCRTCDGLPESFADVLMELADGDIGAGCYINESRGWEFRGSSGGSPDMIKRRTPVWWALWPVRPEVPGDQDRRSGEQLIVTYVQNNITARCPEAK